MKHECTREMKPAPGSESIQRSSPVASLFHHDCVYVEVLRPQRGRWRTKLVTLASCFNFCINLMVSGDSSYRKKVKVQNNRQ